MSIHMEQVASVIRRAVQAMLSRGLSDPRVRGLVSVTSVTVSDDGSHATINVSIMPEEHAELTMHGLRHAAVHIRGQLGREVRLRRLPRLQFKLDKSIKKQSEVHAALAAAARRDAARPASDGSDLTETPPTPPEVSET